MISSKIRSGAVLYAVNPQGDSRKDKCSRIVKRGRYPEENKNQLDQNVNANHPIAPHRMSLPEQNGSNGVWASEENYRTTHNLTASPLGGWWRWNVAERTLFVDRNLRSVLGYLPHERIAHWHELAHPEDLPRLEGSLRRMLATRGKIPCCEELRYLRKDRSAVWVYVRANARFDATGQALAIEAQHQDISDRKHLEGTLRTAVRQLNKRNEEISNFAFITSHDLRSPVTSMVSLVELWEDDPTAENGEFVLGNLASLSRQLLETLDTLNEVINIKRQPDLVKTVTSVRSVFDEAYQSILPVLLQNRVEVSANFGRCPRFYVHRPYLLSVIRHLILNAVAYNTPGHRLNIDLRTEEDHTEHRLLISDDGIDESRRGDRLYGFHNSFQRTPDGRGNGLFLAKAQVEAMDGRITVAVNPEIGTTFTICLPKKF